MDVASGADRHLLFADSLKLIPCFRTFSRSD